MLRRHSLLLLLLGCGHGPVLGPTLGAGVTSGQAVAELGADLSAGRAEASPVLGAAVSPITLSDPDGQELTLNALSARVAVSGPLALTELDLRFRNPQDRRIEGRFSLTLPDGATVSRFAKTVNGQLVEGEVVERATAHRVYDLILHEMRDPALLEQGAGNTFSAKVFPIEPHGEVHIVLAYSQLLRRIDGLRSYSLPLRGLPEIGNFELRGRFAALPGESTSDLPGAERSPDGVQRLDLFKEAWSPDQDLSVRWRARDDSAPQMMRAGDTYLASFSPSVPGGRSKTPRWSFYIDTSASAADGRDHRIAAVEALLRALPVSAPVEIRAFDQEIALVVSGSAGSVAGEVAGQLQRRGFAGATNLERVLADVKEHARTDTRVVLVTDGIATFGDTNLAHLADAAHALPEGLALHALVLGTEQDGAVLSALTRGHGRVVELPLTSSLVADATAAAARLSLPPGAVFSATDPSALWVHTLGGGDVLSGDEVLVVGRLASNSHPTPVLAGNGASLTVPKSWMELRDAGTLLEREAIRAHLDALALQEAAAPSAEAVTALAEEQVRLSVEHRVLCPKTTLLVLESEEDYARFGLDRRALADILTVGPEGVTTVNRAPWGSAAESAQAETDERKAVTAPPPKTAAKETLAKRNLGTKAKAEDQPGRSEGTLAAAPEEVDQPTREALEQALGGEEEEAMKRPDDAASAGARSGSVIRAEGADLVAEPAAGAAVEPDIEPAALPPVARPAASAGPRGAAARAPALGDIRADDANLRDAAPPATRPAVPEWTVPTEVTPARLAELEAAVAANPRAREAYNQLADALYRRAAWERLGAVALAWQPYDPDNPQVYEMMGEAALGRGDLVMAQRAFGSLAELAGGKPELLQRAGLLLWRAGDPASAEVPLRAAIERRPDRVNAWRHLALVLRAAGRHREAAEVLEEALTKTFPEFYQGVHRVMREELETIYHEWAAASPGEKRALQERARNHGALSLDHVYALRVTLVWETDGNDVDLHIVDPSGEECFYGHKQTRSGLVLYGDLTQGLGPEVIRAGRLLPGPYAIGVKYFSAGPMGVSRGFVVIEEAGKAPRVEPFRLVEGGGDLRLISTVVVGDSR